MAIKETRHYIAIQDRFSKEKPVVDVETTQLLVDVGNNPEKLIPCVVGILYQGDITQIYLDLHDNIEKYKDEIRQKLAPIPRPFLAFNSEFDKQVLFGFTNILYNFEEIQEFKRQSKAEACAEYRISIQDPFSNDGRKVIEYYKKYVESKDFKYMKDILRHNIACLCKEYQIHLNIKEKNIKINIYLYTKHNSSNQLVLYVKVKKNLTNWHKNFYDKIAEKGFEYDKVESKDCKIILKNESFTQEIISFLNQEFKLYRPKYHPELHKQIFNNPTEFKYFYDIRKNKKEESRTCERCGRNIDYDEDLDGICIDCASEEDEEFDDEEDL